MHATTRLTLAAALLGLSGNAFGQLVFDGQDFDAGDAASGVALGDFDGDDAIDIAVANRDGDEVVVLFNDNGDFDTDFESVPFDEFSRPIALAAADFDNDGDVDLAVVLLGTDELAVLLNEGNGTFEEPFFFPTGQAPNGIAVANLDDDELGLDIVVSNEEDDTLTILLAADGGFDDFTADVGIDNQRTEPRGVAIGDLDGDGNLDLAVALERQDQLGLLAGRGDGTFDQMFTIDVGDGPTDVAIFDADGADELDLVTANSIDDSVTVLLAGGGGTFQDLGDFPAGNFARSLALADFDDDGVVDAVTANSEGDGVSLLLGDGSGGFEDPIEIDTGNFPFDVAIGDIDDDGLFDIVSANQEGDSVTLLTADGGGDPNDPNDDGELPNPFENCGEGCGALGLAPLALTMIGLFGLKLAPRARRR